MNLLTPLIITLSVALLSACASNVHTELRPIDNPGDITGARTFSWVDSDLSMMAPKEMPSSTFSESIKEEVERSLQELGYRPVKDGSADFTVDAALTLSSEESQYVETKIPFDQEDYSQYGLRWRFGPNESIVKPDPASPNIEIAVYERGTLHVGAFDKSGNIAWHGEAHKVIEHHTPGEHEAVLREATRKLMEKFPLGL